MTFTHVNLNYLTRKLNHVSALLITLKLDILGTSESWLRLNNPDSCVSIPVYEIVRSDGPGDSHKHDVSAHIRESCQYNVVECRVGNVLVVFLCNFDVYLIFLQSSFV